MFFKSLIMVYNQKLIKMYRNVQETKQNLTVFLRQNYIVNKENNGKYMLQS